MYNPLLDDVRPTVERRLTNPVKERELLGAIIHGQPMEQADILDRLRAHHMTSVERTTFLDTAYAMLLEGRTINPQSLYQQTIERASPAQEAELRKEYGFLHSMVMEDTVENTVELLENCYRSRVMYYDVSLAIQTQLRENVPAEQILSNIDMSLIKLDDDPRRKTLKDHLTDMLDEILNPSERNSGKYVGLGPIDEQFGGFCPDTLLVLGGFSGSGKTATMIDIIQRLCELYPDEVAICVFSLEMSQKRLLRRLASRKSGVSDYRMKTHSRHGKPPLTEAETNAILDAHNEMLEYPMEVFYEPFDARRMKQRARYFALKNRGKHLFYFLDHLGEVQKDPGNARLETDQNLQVMKDLCMEYEATCIVLSQLTKEVEGKANRPYCRPNRSHIMESVGVIAKADILVLLWRPEIYAETMPFEDIDEWATAGLIFWLIEKNRDGHAPNDVLLACDIKLNRLSEYVTYNAF